VTGQPERAVGTVQDVTELRHAVEAVRASQQMLEHLLECFPNGSINVFDSDLRYVMAAGRGLVQVGLAPEKLIGKTLAELFPAELLAVVEAPYRRAFAGETATVDLPLAGRIYTLNAAPLDRVDSVVRTIIVVAQEVTERVQAEQGRVEQRERQARLEGMLFTARHLTARVTSSLAASFSVIERLQPDPGLSPHVRDAVDAATTGLSEATRAIADLERLIHPATLEQPVRPAADDHPSNPKA
jgi:PAS domain S-box-containing protein